MDDTRAFEELHRSIPLYLAFMHSYGIVPETNSDPSAFDLLGLVPGSPTTEQVEDALDTMTERINNRIEGAQASVAREIRALAQRSARILSDPQTAKAYLQWRRAQQPASAPPARASPPPRTSVPVTGTASTGTTGYPVGRRLFGWTFACLLAWSFPLLRGGIGWAALLCGGIAYFRLKAKGHPAFLGAAALALAGIYFVLTPQRPIYQPNRVVYVPAPQSPEDGAKQQAQRQAEEAKRLVIEAHMLLKASLENKRRHLSDPAQDEQNADRAAQMLARALNLCSDALQKYPATQLAYLERGFALHYEDHDQWALATVQEGLKRFPSDSELLELQQNLKAKLASASPPGR